MAKKIELSQHKTYATEENAIKAVEKIYGDADLRYFIAWNREGCFPVFIGTGALDHGVHFHFNIVA